ncbi:hypothetical protein [Paenibacillus sedimenti]|uniref:Uncharacterized protein n=1 Tax=Paenibacillus sedimenti TaxID=2770274 RepID=A0A926KPU5_9BACL|nr:hypothetical protein [Paenibacillus sedimenti]MBD0381277.1 hypothetical protein [Paenibacillus sedimenti]
MSITVTEVMKDGIPYRITEDVETGMYIEECIQEITLPEVSMQEKINALEQSNDFLGQLLVEKDLQILDLQSQNNLLGQQLVAMDLRLLQGGL